MNRRTLLLALPLLALTPPRAQAATQADTADIARVQAYLNGLHTLKARFLQIAPDGTTTQGTAWLERPGHMRFEYDKPSPLLLVAGNGVVIFHDAELDQTSKIPLQNTPLGILLDAHVDLTTTVTVQSIERLPGQLILTLARTATPGEGQLALTLADNPLQLRSWVVTDAQRNQTRVSLFNIDLGGTFAPSLFQYTPPPPAP